MQVSHCLGMEACTDAGQSLPGDGGMQWCRSVSAWGWRHALMQVSQCLGMEACTDAGQSVPGEGGMH